MRVHGTAMAALAAGAVLLLCSAPYSAHAAASAEASASAYASGGGVAKADSKASAYSDGGTAHASASAYAGVEDVTYEKPEEYKATYGAGKPWTAPKLDVTPYAIHKPVEVYHTPPECPMASDYLDCEKCAYCGDKYPWSHWLFGYEWEAPEVYESDYCDVVSYHCEKSCETEEYCEPKCEEAYEDECHPVCEDVPYEHCPETCHEYEDEECTHHDCPEPAYCDPAEVCLPEHCSHDCPHCGSSTYGRRLLAEDDDDFFGDFGGTAISEAESLTDSGYASGKALGAFAGENGKAESSVETYAGDGEAAARAEASAVSYDAPEDPKCDSTCAPCECTTPECPHHEPCEPKVCKPVTKTKCEPTCVTKYKKECKQACTKVPKHDCKEHCYTKYTGHCELLCVEEEAESLYCYCPKH